MKKSKVIAMVLALILALSVLPAGAAAAEGPALKRGELILRLWEMAGSPTPTLTESPYLDVNAEDACYAAVLWASETGLTDGVGGGRFAPEEEATRAQLVAFLWKRAGRPAAAAELPFLDTAENAWYAPALQWALSAGVIRRGVGVFPRVGRPFRRPGGHAGAPGRDRRAAWAAAGQLYRAVPGDAS